MFDIGLGTCLEQAGQQICVGIGGQIDQVLLDDFCMSQSMVCWAEQQRVAGKEYHPGTTHIKGQISDDRIKPTLSEAEHMWRDETRRDDACLFTFFFFLQFRVVATRRGLVWFDMRRRRYVVVSVYVCVCELCKKEYLGECSDSKFEWLKVEKVVAKVSKESRSDRQQNKRRRAFSAG